MGGQEHFYLETNVTLCQPGEGGEMEIISSTQNANMTQMCAAHTLGIPANKVDVRVKRLGGGFGGKETRSVGPALACCVAAARLGRAVKLCLDRDVDMLITGTRHPFVGRYRCAAAAATGRLVWAEISLIANGGWSLDLSGAVLDRAVFHAMNAYYIPSLRVAGRVARTNTASNTAFRGFGAPQGMVVCEAMLDHVATAAGLPPLQVREMNLIRNGQRTAYGQTLTHCSLVDGVARLKISSDYEARSASVAVFNRQHTHKQRGLALLPVMFGIAFTAKFMNQGGALVHVYGDGSVRVSHGGVEMGQGLHTKVAQVAARAFRIPLHMVSVKETATDKVANASPTAASMSTDLYAMATLDACETILKRLEPVRQQQQQQQQQQQGEEEWKALVRAALFSRVDLSAHGFYIVADHSCGYDFDMVTSDNSERGQPFNYHTFGAAAAEVEVDVLTGDVAVVRADVLVDVGNSINPAIDIGQVEGAFVQGVGLFTTEELVWGDADHPWMKPGQLLTRGPGTYKIPSFNDAPRDFRIELMPDSPNPTAVHSSRAVGEPPLFLGASVFFAVKDAIRSARSARARLTAAEAALASLSLSPPPPPPVLGGEQPQQQQQQQQKELGVEEEEEHLQLWSPASSERVRMAVVDPMSARFLRHKQQQQGGGGGGTLSGFQAKGSF